MIGAIGSILLDSLMKRPTAPHLHMGTRNFYSGKWFALYTQQHAWDLHDKLAFVLLKSAGTFLLWETANMSIIYRSSVHQETDAEFGETLIPDKHPRLMQAASGILRHHRTLERISLRFASFSNSSAKAGFENGTVLWSCSVTVGYVQTNFPPAHWSPSRYLAYELISSALGRLCYLIREDAILPPRWNTMILKWLPCSSSW